MSAFLIKGIQIARHRLCVQNGVRSIDCNSKKGTVTPYKFVIIFSLNISSTTYQKMNTTNSCAFPLFANIFRPITHRWHAMFFRHYTGNNLTCARYFSENV